MNMRRTTAPCSRVRLEPYILRLQGLKTLLALLIAPSASKILLWSPVEPSSQSKETRKRWIVNYGSDQANGTDLLSCYECA